MINLLPIGSVVALKGGDKKLMIYGRIQYNTELDQTFDYLGCFYPEGNIGEEHNYLFNHEDIDELYHTGYANEEEEELLAELNEFIDSQRSDE